MAQNYNEHLTSEQISAFCDKQLSPEEQAVFDAHMSTCQQCQRNLVDFRLTVSLLRSMPQEAAPRSFVLPVGPTAVPQQTARHETFVTPTQQKRRGRFTTLRRSVRVVSALAAVLALMLIVSGILPTSLPGASETASTHAPTSSSGEATIPHAAVSTPHVQKTPVDHNQEGVAIATRTPVATQTPAPTGTTTEHESTGTPADQGSGIQPVIDLSQPVVRLSLGVVVLALSIIVLVLTRRRRANARG